MSRKCANCGSGIGGIFGSQLIEPAVIKEYKQLIECPDELCTKCDGGFPASYEEAKRKRALAKSGDFNDLLADVQQQVLAIPVVSVETLPASARYRLVGLVTHHSTLGTGLISELSSELSNILGGEAHVLNSKMATSLDLVKRSLQASAFRLGANAVIGVAFQFTTNTRDATTVAAQGTAVSIENLSDVFAPANPERDS
jgi:uncharacterized protein YbjQ (UPF0145 family)